MTHFIDDDIRDTHHINQQKTMICRMVFWVFSNTFTCFGQLLIPTFVLDSSKSFLNCCQSCSTIPATAISIQSPRYMLMMCFTHLDRISTTEIEIQLPGTQRKWDSGLVENSDAKVRMFLLENFFRIRCERNFTCVWLLYQVSREHSVPYSRD